MKKLDLLKSDIKMLFSTMYLCSNCKKEIIRGEGYCDGCGEELIKTKEANIFKRFNRICFFNQIIILFISIFILGIISGFIALIIWSEIGPF